MTVYAELKMLSLSVAGNIYQILSGQEDKIHVCNVLTLLLMKWPDGDIFACDSKNDIFTAVKI